MKEKSEKMEAQFKEAANRMRLQPSEKAWKQLENKLDLAAQKQPRRIPQWVWAVAATFVLAFATFWWQRPSGNSLELLVHSQPPASLEDLEATGSCEPYCLMLKHRHELPLDYRYPPVNSLQ